MSIRERGAPLRRSMPWGRLLLLGFFGMSLTSLMMTLSIELSSGVSAAIASATNPISSAVTARLLHRVPLLPGIVLGAALSTAGALVAIIGGAGAAVTLGGGELLVIAANVLWTWYSMMAQRWLAGYPQLHIAGLTALIMISRLTVGEPVLATGLELEAIAMTVIGGTSLFGGEGGVIGTILGAAIVTVLANMLNLFGVSPFTQQIVKGFIIVAAVLFETYRRNRNSAK